MLARISPWPLSTKKLADVDMNQYDAIFYPGGHGPLWDLAEDEKSVALIKTAYEQDKVIGAVCHAPAVFKNVFVKPDQNIVGGSPTSCPSCWKTCSSRTTAATAAAMTGHRTLWWMAS